MFDLKIGDTFSAARAGVAPKAQRMSAGRMIRRAKVDARICVLSLVISTAILS
jgi:hypothetical protein